MSERDKTLIAVIKACKFSCEAGSLEMSIDFDKLIKATDLWVIIRGGDIVKHTSGVGGWRFPVFTTKEEAQFLADATNTKHYAGANICSVRHLLSVNNQA